MNEKWWKRINVKNVNFETTEIFAVIIFKVAQGGFSIQQCILNIQKEWQTVWTVAQIRKVFEDNFGIILVISP